MFIGTPESKHIHGYEYDKDKQVLVITFKRMFHKYKYTNVPDNIIDGFRTATSKSTYFSKFIKGKFDCIKLQF